MEETIADAYTKFMSGSDIDVERFVDAALELAARIGPMTGRVVDATTIRLGVEPNLIAISGDAAVAKLRMMCARLATIFGTSVYGGTIERDGTKLTLNNQSGDVRFGIEITR